VTRLRSSVLALLTLDLRERGLLAGTISDDLWGQFADADGLRSEMWLSAYEVTRKGWWSKARSTSFIKHNKCFSMLESVDISFYDPRRQARARTGSDFLKLLLTRSAHSIGYDSENDKLVEPDYINNEDAFSVYD
jgi:hypothetical protein